MKREEEREREREMSYYSKAAGTRNPRVSQGTLVALRFLGPGPQIIRDLPRELKGNKSLGKAVSCAPGTLEVSLSPVPCDLIVRSYCQVHTVHPLPQRKRKEPIRNEVRRRLPRRTTPRARSQSPQQRSQRYRLAASPCARTPCNPGQARSRPA